MSSYSDSGKTMIIPIKIKKVRRGLPGRTVNRLMPRTYLFPRVWRGVGLSIFTRFLYTPTAGAIAALSLKTPSLSRGRGGWGKL